MLNVKFFQINKKKYPSEVTKPNFKYMKSSFKLIYWQQKTFKFI
jgi:hypothetical protein